jgi:hypothetical protein
MDLVQSGETIDIREAERICPGPWRRRQNSWNRPFSSNTARVAQKPHYEGLSAAFRCTQKRQILRSSTFSWPRDQLDAALTSIARHRRRAQQSRYQKEQQSIYLCYRPPKQRCSAKSQCKLMISKMRKPHERSTCKQNAELGSEG